MASFKASDVIRRVRRLINDEVEDAVAGVRWTDDELLDWITLGQFEIATLQPEAVAETDIFHPADKLPRQSLDPRVAWRLIRVEANGFELTYSYLTSRIYPVEARDALLLNSDALAVSQYSAGDFLDLGSDVISGSLLTTLTSFDGGFDELDLASDIVSGSIVAALVSFDGGFDELDLASDIVSGSLALGLIVYSDYPAESLDLSSTITSGSLV